MKKFICILLCLFLLTGCVSSENKKIVRDTIETYFNALTSKDYDTANSMVISGDETISAIIEESNVNNVIFENVSYEIWNITEEDDLLCADVVITQISLQAAYTDAVKEYAKYVEDANAQNKKFTDEALEGKWNDIFYKHVSAVTEKVSLRCNVYIQIADNETPVILMTADFRNALFGGELDAIKALQKG